MEMGAKNMSGDAKHLMDLHRKLFPQIAGQSIKAMDKRGNFVMPSAYRPTRTTYVSRVN